MLYLTTRNKHDVYTYTWTLASDQANNGGLYLPFKLPMFTPADVVALKDKTFGQTVADMLNLFFSTKLTGWDVEFTIGRYPIKTADVGQKVIVAECWRNLDGSYDKMEKNLAARICGCSVSDVKITSWLRVAIRICVLVGIFGELHRQGIDESVDIAVPVGDFSHACAVWYCRRMGLPIGNIICGCTQSDAVWDLLHMGQIRTAGGVDPELERLIYGTFGVDETLKFCACCEKGSVYSLLPHLAKELRSGMFASVVSEQRVNAAIPNVFSTSSYVMAPDVAASYSSLLDYRAKTGERRMALLLADNNPADSASEVASTLKISEEKLKELLR